MSLFHSKNRDCDIFPVYAAFSVGRIGLNEMHNYGIDLS